MPEYTVKWPLEFNSVNTGFTTLGQEELKEVAVFNLKNILLTVPGERIMYPNFGVGVKEYLFEQNNDLIFQNLEVQFRNQVDIWCPYINIETVNFNSVDNTLNIRVKYSITAIEINDELNLDIPL